MVEEADNYLKDDWIFKDVSENGKFKVFINLSFSQHSKFKTVEFINICKYCAFQRA